MDDPDQVVEYNRRAWDALVAAKNRWTRPVDSQQIENARLGIWQIVLTPTKPVPKDWFPDFSASNVDVLCLASGGGQQGPILAAAGANVTVFDNSPSQLEQDNLVARREGLEIRTEQGDMANLAVFDEQSFDLIFHPCSNCFAQDIHPVWKECFRVLRPGGTLLTGFTNPVRYLFDDELLENGELFVRYKIPYSDLTSISPDLRQRYIDKNEPCCFSHTLSDQISGQLNVGFELIGFYEDKYETDDVLSQYIDSFIATRALKPKI